MKRPSPQVQTLVEETLTALRLGTGINFTCQTVGLLKNLYALANFAEARRILIYMPTYGGFEHKAILQHLFLLRKSLHFALTDNKALIKIYKVDALKDLIFKSAFNLPHPNPNTCKQVRLSDIDIIIVNGIAFDEKGNRMGNSLEFYDKLMAKFAPTVRKVALAFESQFLPAIPAEARDTPVDIIVTDKRTIYKT